jgi:hypothetical protein
MENNKSGPKTPEGKAVSKLNALKHGILSQEVLIEGEDENTLKSLSEALIDELKPLGPIEEVLVDRIISSLWRLRRSINAEKNTMEYVKNDGFVFAGLDGVFDEKQGDRSRIKNMLTHEGVETILRYETTIERSLLKALHELERIQARRNGKNVPLPGVVDVNIDSSFGKNTP